ncbi:hypothetical protein H696_03604 [Fonticula alba]|uniref:F-type H+-transporting ATPase subunit epsilon n=1 Tax=Fonticula alba TaxID=691883 RepID=A0A058Z799_FONAL|nr:hypothetical protein H696_03604 [Fonticula alba]KCV70145.1 hypothetical protein H696_03604 [Fonticula alba]|eukprot:XP_009495751.1 hypothetical protein H696_03604 [Fonticula alba]
MIGWRAAGFNYAQYSQLCARALRSVLKESHAANVARREATTLRVSTWENGVASPPKYVVKPAAK